MSDQLEQLRSREWFYRFELPDGTTTPTYHDGELNAIHDTRWRMLEHRLEAEFPGGFGDLRAIDLAAHQGWFATKLAQANLRQVTCVDANESHVEDARLITGVLGLDEVECLHSDIFQLDPAALGKFDLVLMFGLLYHLENPVGALRLAHALCGRLCVVETQVIPGMSGMVDFGSFQFVKPLHGSFGVLDETAETHGPEAGVSGICLVPSVEALTWLLEKVGFTEVEVLQPPADAYEQLLYGKRVVVAACV
jgi:tRNA (mo5U34)-methyltransferase